MIPLKIRLEHFELELALVVTKIPPIPVMVTALTQINQNKIALATLQ